MNKDTFYFSHDYNARNDIKVKKLITRHGYLGYGIFWSIIEDLYNNANALPLDYECIAYDMRTSENVIDSIINDFDLFVIENGFFGSSSVERRLNERNLKSIKAKESANSRWKKIKDNANALRTESDSNAIKESKGKEIKEDLIKILNNSLMSEIKISDDKKFFKINEYFIEAEENYSEFFKIANQFRVLFIKNLREKNSPTYHQENSKFKSYVNPIRLMIEKKEATKDQLREAYNFLNSNEGEFWKSNILSTETLRKNIQKVLAKKNTKLQTGFKEKNIEVIDPNKRNKF